MGKKPGQGKSATDPQRMRVFYLKRKEKLGSISEAEVDELAQTMQDIRDYHAVPFKKTVFQRFQRF